MVLFLRSIKSFHYIPENESEQPVLVRNTSSVVNMDRVYKRRGFHISMLHVYGKFYTYHIKNSVVELKVILNPVSEDDNVP